MYQKGHGGPETLLAPTELWLWGAVAVDVLIAGLLSYSLRKMKKGFNKSSAILPDER
jgi:hypothetical protein